MTGKFATLERTKDGGMIRFERAFPKGLLRVEVTPASGDVAVVGLATERPPSHHLNNF